MARSSMHAPTPLLAEAIDHAAGGDWERAHVLVQDHEGDPIADWIHAVCHRMEGDLGNARYWYNRVRRPFPEASTRDELEEIRTALTQRRR